MSEIVFVTWDGGGNVPPALALAGGLADRGHAVRFIGHAAQREPLNRAGFEVIDAPRARSFDAAGPHSMMSFVRTFGDRGMGRDLCATLERRPADLVVVDCFLIGVMDVLRRRGIDFVVLEHLYDAYFRAGVLAGPLALALTASGRRPRRAVAAARSRLLTTLPALDPVDDPQVRQVGPVVDGATVTSEEPLVLVSLSTFGFPRMADCLQRVVDACAGLPDRVVVTTGPMIAPDELRVPAGVEVHRFVPHAELLPHATLLIGHGGHGTTMQALAHGVPVVVMPMDPTTDQPQVGASLEAIGAGRVVAKDASVAELATVIRELAAPGPHRTVAAELAATIRATDAVAAGVAHLEEVLAQPLRA
ncbi:UDP:flavonoid glycosyltransferase YjiC (YdhE family) [Nocardioides massiliensis]|uniref:UDP:flavonoid glycosyltransferase YjiC (YdhE family) n=3 Tax=Nocardioides massiliensis TaxID=1325935 RepID=A0ABT9NP02_9ACTN|nr:glycosyltransferase [Nocardioides massiliensis]MDP9822133.1 UDP:flavonoid glycosyltransferase YjiC (YdhE family) [Nocardioides massiliensis]